MATPDNGVAAILYNTSELTAKVGNRSGITVRLKQTTDYPFDEHIKIEVNTPKPVDFPLYLRVPGWCNGATVSVNGQPVEIPANPGSYIRLQNKWKQGDVVELTLSMKIVLQEWTKNKNSMSVEYGPLTFSLKIGEYYKQVDSRESAISDSRWQANADPALWPAYDIYPTTMWNYGLALNSKPLNDQFEIIKRPWPKSNFPFTQDSVPLILKAKGKIIPQWTLDQYGLCGLLPQSPVAVHTKEQEIELIPMGAARLRISAFPVVE
jgi:hypothetical protein